MNQTIMVFSSASARTTALASVLAEGMVSYRTDSHILEYYNGTAWTSAIPSPTITTGAYPQTLIPDSTTTSGLRWADDNIILTTMGAYL